MVKKVLEFSVIKLLTVTVYLPDHMSTAVL